MLGARGHVAAENAFRAGASEFEIALEFMKACGQRERELPYNPIIALNEGGAVLHYQIQQRTKPAKLHSLLIDAGAEFGGYASDITRTHSYHDAEFAAHHQAIRRAAAQALRAGARRARLEGLPPGVVSRDQRVPARDRRHQRERDEAIDSALTSVFYPHGIGHLLGLQVHDVGGLQGHAGGKQIERPYNHPFLRLTRKLEDGCVVTVEPGFYFIDQLLDEAKAKPIGKMIEWKRVDSSRSSAACASRTTSWRAPGGARESDAAGVQRAA